MAATLEDYGQRLDRAAVYTDELFQEPDSGPRNLNSERNHIDEITLTVPPKEKIEWPGGGMETGNEWLGQMLAEFSAESNLSKRRDILTGISERLEAISQSVKDLEAGTAVQRTKDEDKQKLAEILSREEYQKPGDKEESLFQRWLRQFWEWLAKFFPSPSLSPETQQSFGSLKYVLQILIYLGVVALILFLIYKFGPHLAGRLGIRSREKKGDRVILGERIAADESARDLFDEAERLARDGKLRDAIRKGYIAALCELSDRKIIGLARHKTNRDYLRDVRKRTDLFENMSGLTGTYERNWYGLRPSEQEDWEDFRIIYRRTIADV